MNYFIKNLDFLDFINFSNGNPDLGDLSTIAPSVIASVVLMTISLIFPCIVWFIRNFMRIVLKKNYELFNRSFKWLLLFSLVLFILSIILMVLATQGII